MAIASIDNIEMANMIRPALTTVDIPKHKLAEFTIQTLQTQRDYAVDSPVSIVIPTRLIVRESCGSRMQR